MDNGFHAFTVKCVHGKCVPFVYAKCRLFRLISWVKFFLQTESFTRFSGESPNFCGDCQFYRNDITPRNEVESLQENDCMEAHFHISIR